MNEEFSQQTAEAVQRFQSTAHVTGDQAGVVGRPTLTALVAAGPTPRLDMGASGEDVRRVQSALAIALNRELPANGQFGPEMLQAVKDYQSSRGITPVSGTVATKTWGALQTGR